MFDLAFAHAIVNFACDTSLTMVSLTYNDLTHPHTSFNRLVGQYKRPTRADASHTVPRHRKLIFPLMLFLVDADAKVSSLDRLERELRYR